MTPIELKLAQGQRVLAITWEDGAVSRLDAAVLRARSRDASMLRAEMDGSAPASPEVKLTGIDPIGAYAVRLSFSDGHDRGIYPWPYLRILAEETQKEPRHG